MTRRSFHDQADLGADFPSSWSPLSLRYRHWALPSEVDARTSGHDRCRLQRKIGRVHRSGFTRLQSRRKSIALFRAALISGKDSYNPCDHIRQPTARPRCSWLLVAWEGCHLAPRLAELASLSLGTAPIPAVPYSFRGEIMGVAQDTYEQVRQCFNQHDLNALRALTADDAVIVRPTPGKIEGSEAIGNYFTQLFSMFPDIEVHPSRYVEQGNVVVVQGSWTGTHQGPAVLRDGRTVPATGRRVECPMVDIAEVQDGKIFRSEMYSDGLTLLTQLGLEPSAAST